MSIQFLLTIISIGLSLTANPSAAREKTVLWPALNSPPPVNVKLSYASEEIVGDYDIRIDYQATGARNWEVLLLLNTQDADNCYRLTVGREHSRLTRVQLGLEIELANAGGVGESHAGTLHIRRRSNRLQVFATRRLLLQAFDETFAAGTFGYAVLQDGVKLGELKVQPAERITFSDDFMRTEDDTSEWKTISGYWQVKALRNPLRSSNAFTFCGQASRGPAISLTGNWYWSDYRLRAAVKGMKDRGVGLIGYYQNRDNYVVFEWTGRGERDAGGRRLIHVREGVRRILDEQPGGYVPGQWYDLLLVFRANTVEAFIDGRLVCRGEVETLPGGRVGLYCADPQGAYFDDVCCESIQDTSCEFNYPRSADDRNGCRLATASRGEWQELGGKWQIVMDSAGESLCEVRTASLGRAVMGRVTWTDYEVSADVARVASGSSGLCFYYLDESEHFLVRNSPQDPQCIELVEVTGDKEHTLAIAKVSRGNNAFRHFAARIDRNLITVFVDGSPVIEHYAGALVGGKAGLYAEDCHRALFDNFAVTFAAHEPEPVFTVHEVFGGEVSMANWAATQSDWTLGRTVVNNTPVICQWHRSPFYGDVEIEASVLPTKGMLALVVAATEKSLMDGYALVVSGSGVTLTRNGVEVARAAMSPVGEERVVRLRKSGKTVIAVVDGVTCLSYQDQEPLSGSNVGWGTSNYATEKDSVKVYSRNVITDTFRCAPSNWRAAGGLWEVKSRWQCDPRWSFFAGENHDGPAVLWNKRSYRGDIMVEFAVGIKMQRNRGTYRDFARDMNVTICADGKELDSGYSFVFAGWRNQKNALLREGKIVAEAPPPKLDDTIHRKWFLIRAEKKGGQLKYFVDDQLVCQYDDPNPLAGDRLALWTYRCGMMVSRFRVSAESVGERESFDEEWPGVSRTFYDGPS